MTLLKHTTLVIDTVDTAIDEIVAATAEFNTLLGHAPVPTVFICAEHDGPTYLVMIPVARQPAAPTQELLAAVILEIIGVVRATARFIAIHEPAIDRRGGYIHVWPECKSIPVTQSGERHSLTAEGRALLAFLGLAEPA